MAILGSWWSGITAPSGWRHILPDAGLKPWQINLSGVCLWFGIPLELHSDQGTNFESAVFAEMCRVWASKTRTATYNPSQMDWLSNSIRL